MDQPNLSREMTVHAAEHEIFLSFVNDEDAELFSDWWNTKGAKLWSAWSDKEKEKRERKES